MDRPMDETMRPVRVADGFYALGPYRIQRNSRGWSWWHVVQIEPGYARGKSATLKGAISAALLAAKGDAP